ncbi:hypothetical protein CAOG_04370 [Capsaspora owczarzaki ATCC 30864]|uniref:Transcription initiation factor TFIID component TAF4 C-terminal domain-containing protein n=1 Tax=Capsaspora owczarzaki (strain ATCC 30864) TaxID=595528 RepID=A0A0D2WR67_CAPO3|nr:hypothetical protein CAOG_04370 [Capsaspora owczarzaki ATCC 30864]KJE93608.1 hypothetical protein CAOG_004370 [Capsaspora owczarzaki ATCC 30864]|eukprot:XP_004348198.1 hypothetical protein CAOG_04370 [Capsaspora owczarzaki ATCC 30864]
MSDPNSMFATETFSEDYLGTVVGALGGLVGSVQPVAGAPSSAAAAAAAPIDASMANMTGGLQFGPGSSAGTAAGGFGSSGHPSPASFGFGLTPSASASSSSSAMAMGRAPASSTGGAGAGAGASGAAGGYSMPAFQMPQPMMAAPVQNFAQARHQQLLREQQQQLHLQQQHQLQKEQARAAAGNNEIDHNDLLAVAGVDEEAENELLKQSFTLRRPEKVVVIPVEPQFINRENITRKVQQVASAAGLFIEDLDVNEFLGHALELYLRNILEKLFVISEHRYEVFRTLYPTTTTSEPKRLLTLLQRVDAAREAARQEHEREAILRAFKDRKNLDDEQRERAKRLQADADIRSQQRRANQALAQVLPKSNRPSFLDSARSSNPLGDSGDGDEFVPVGADGTAQAGANPDVNASHMKRAQAFDMAPYPHTVTIKDLLMYMNGDARTKRSPLYFKALIRQATVGNAQPEAPRYLV